MGMEKLVSTSLRLQNLMSELTVLRRQVEQAERNQPQSIVQFDRLMESRKIETARDLPPENAA